MPATRNDAWVRNPIDGFVLRALEAEGLEPAPPASHLALLRRAHFDLLGLPPSPETVARFLVDGAPDAYERLIEQLLVLRATPGLGWQYMLLAGLREMSGEMAAAVAAVATARGCFEQADDRRGLAAVADLDRRLAGRSAKRTQSLQS